MASQGARATTGSICSSETEKATHTFQISGYSQHCGLGVAKYICSTRFTIGGHEWRIRYYPDGANEECKDYVAVHLEPMSQLTKVRLVYDFKLRNQATSQLSYTSISSSSAEFTADGPPTCGTDEFIEKNELEKSRYLWDDCLEIECDVTVIKESRLREIAIRPYTFHVQVPPSDLSDHLSVLFSSGQEADFTFTVQEETFRAHRLALEMRSPVFKELFRQQPRDQRTACTSSIKIEDMEPAVFKALLHFIYTDKLQDQDGHKNEEMAKNLFAAADKYAMARLKLLCGNILSKGLTVQSVTDTLALADKHRCKELKDACIQFTISSKRRMADVLSSEGYRKLKAACPAVALEMLEKSEMFKAAIINQVPEGGRPAQVNGEGSACADHDEGEHVDLLRLL
ncbi:unnamed protein product [Urochloa decumbens]|uniref:Uncharacterized protein n=1 Tax=Urochloa decumbens TaxID=240449 RepID=A0ABC8VZ83_9POAL